MTVNTICAISFYVNVYWMLTQVNNNAWQQQKFGISYILNLIILIIG